MVELPKESMLLRAYFGEKDKFEGKPLYEVIVQKARQMHMAGATVLRGPIGYGQSSHIHRANFLEVSEDLPIVVEIVDTFDKINTFLPVLDAIQSGLVTLEKVQVVRYGSLKK